MQSGKAPDPDDYPTEFSKTLLDKLAPLLLDMFVDSLNQGNAP